jgi:molecular chaperone DnaJ
MSDHYSTLGVDKSATADEIKKAYRRLARELHPDVNPDPETQGRFKEVTAAYEVLSDPEKRQMYDLGHDPYASGGGFGAGFGFSDIMDAFFGQSGSRGPRPRMRRGQDALIRISLDLAEACFGTQRQITVETAVTCSTCTGAGTAAGSNVRMCEVCKGRGEVQHVTRSFLGQVMTARPCTTCQGYGSVIPHPCSECAGEGRVRTRKTLDVPIPGGVETGTRIQLAGQGEVGPGGGPAGDLYVEIVQEQHPTLEREADDLHTFIAIPMSAAALGTEVTIETLDGERDVAIPAGLQSGERIELSGLGMTRLRGYGRGNLFVHVEVQTPTRLTTEQQELLQQFAQSRGEDGKVVAPEDHGVFGKIRDAFR